MDSLYDCLFLKHGLAFGAGTLIFLLTIILVSRRVIGFTLSVIFILIALGVSLGIEHPEIVKSYINKIIPGTFKTEEEKIERIEPSPVVPTPAETVPSEKKEEQLQLRGQVERQKSRIQKFVKNEELNE